MVQANFLKNINQYISHNQSVRLCLYQQGSEKLIMNEGDFK